MAAERLSNHLSLSFSFHFLCATHLADHLPERLSLPLSRLFINHFHHCIVHNECSATMAEIHLSQFVITANDAHFSGADLVAGILLCPLEFIQRLAGTWIFGTALCKIVAFVQISASGRAVMFHVLIAVDRYRCLAHLHLPKLKTKLVRRLIALSWVLPALVATPYLTCFKLSRSMSTKCAPHLPFQCHGSTNFTKLLNSLLRT